MPKRRSRRQRYTQEPGAEAIATSSYNTQTGNAQAGRRRTVRRSWFSRISASTKTYGVIAIILVSVVTLMFFAIRQSFGNDFEFTMYQGDVGVPSQNAKFRDMFPSDKPVVLNFWAGLCHPCRAEMPGFQRVYDEYQDRITLLGLDVGPYMNLGSRGDARRLLSELNITYPTGYAHSRDPVAQFGVTAMPTTIFLTPDGKVFRTSVGFIDEVAWRGTSRISLRLRRHRPDLAHRAHGTILAMLSPMKRPTASKEKPGVASRKGAHDREAREHRGWGLSLGLAAVIVGAGIGLSAVINPLLGRNVHWDWMAVLAHTLLVVLAIALRRRWV